jgi:hypothetical protein
MPALHDIQRSTLPIPDVKPCRVDDVRREGSRHAVSTDHAFATPGGRAERIDHPARRRGIRRIERVRRTLPNAHGGAPGCERPEVQPLPHHGAVLAHARGNVVGPQPSRGRHGGITEIATSAPGYNSLRPNTCAPWRRFSSSMATRRRSSASATKSRVSRRPPIGPYHHWPTGSGFEHFFGFHRRREQPVLPRALRPAPRPSNRIARPSRAIT